MIARFTAGVIATKDEPAADDDPFRHTAPTMTPHPEWGEASAQPDGTNTGTKDAGLLARRIIRP